MGVTGGASSTAAAIFASVLTGFASGTTAATCAGSWAGSSSLTAPVVEQSLELNPGYLKALEVLAWVYSTYPEYLGDDSAHETALEYALELFEAHSETDPAAYEILGAAYYANGDLTSGALSIA